MNPLTWLRRKAAEAIVLGTADGIRAVTPEGDVPPEDLDSLRKLLAANTQTKQLTVAASPTPEPSPLPPAAVPEPEPEAPPADPWILLLDAARDEPERRKLETSIRAEIRAGRIKNGQKKALEARLAGKGGGS